MQWPGTSTDTIRGQNFSSLEQIDNNDNKHKNKNDSL